jgi:hypothetical protein
MPCATRPATSSSRLVRTGSEGLGRWGGARPSRAKAECDGVGLLEAAALLEQVGAGPCRRDRSRAGVQRSAWACMARAGGRVPHGAVGALQRRSPFVLVTGGGDPGERLEAPRDAAALVQALDLREGVALGRFSASEVAL